MRFPTIFAQLLQWIPRDDFQKNVDEFEGDKKTRRLTCWGQFVALLFGQLTGHNGLRAITAGLKTVKTNFVTRLKKNHKFKVLTCTKTDRTQGIMADQVIRMTGQRGSEYEGKLRRVSFRDPETGKHLVFITNRFDLSSKTICALYKARWDVELFFKTMKQYLQIKKFVGTSVNAVKSQVWVALIAYLLMMAVKFLSKVGWSTPMIMASLTAVLFSNVPLMGIWEHVPKERCYILKSQQLLLFEF